MYHLTMAKLTTLMAVHDPPCISIYLPTHRKHPENQQDPVRFRNLIRTAEESLRRLPDPQDIEARLEPLRALASNLHFWKHTRDGLAVLLSPDMIEVIQVQRPFPELAIVANSFHIKPLVRYLQSADRFQVLALTRDSAVVFAGNRYTMDEEPVNDEFPSRMEQVAMAEQAESRVSVAVSSGGVGSPRTMHGRGDGRDDLETEKYFRAVDRAFTAQFSGPSGLPVMLAALPEHQALFRRVSQNPLLLPEGTNGNPRPLTDESLRKQAWKVLEPYYLARLDELGESYRSAAAKQSGSADLSDVAQAAVAGRVGTLLLEADRVIPGVIDRVTGAVRPGELQSPDVDDMLDDLAELVLDKGGTVVIVPTERMPATTGLAASYRF